MQLKHVLRLQTRDLLSIAENNFASSATFHFRTIAGAASLWNADQEQNPQGGGCCRQSNSRWQTVPVGDKPVFFSRRFF